MRVADRDIIGSHTNSHIRHRINVTLGTCTSSPAAESLVTKANKTRHRDAVHECTAENIFADALSGCPSGVDDSNDGPFVPSARAPDVALCSSPEVADKVTSSGARGSENVHTLSDIRIDIHILDPGACTTVASQYRQRWDQWN